MPHSKNFYEGTPGHDMIFDPSRNAYVGCTMDGVIVEVSKDDFERDAQNYFGTNLAVWWLLNRPAVATIRSKQ